MPVMLARTRGNGFSSCPNRTSSPIRPRAFAQVAQSGIYYEAGPLCGSHDSRKKPLPHGRGSDWNAVTRSGSNTVPAGYRKKKCMLNYAEEILRSWETDPRWNGIVRPYTAEDVVRLRGTVRIEYTL